MDQKTGAAVFIPQLRVIIKKRHLINLNTVELEAIMLGLQWAEIFRKL